MQRVERVNPNISPIMDDIDRLYAVLSEEQGNTLVYPQFDSSLQGIVDLFNRWTRSEWQISGVVENYPSVKSIKNNNLILAFSGGKDSIASAIKWKNAGYNVYLYHMRHINPSFADEWKCAKRSAELLDMPIFFDDIKFSGHHMYMEHPMKNMIIANGALSYGIREGITTNIAFGNYTSSMLIDNPFDRCAGDCMDMWDSYNAVIQRVLPRFRIWANLENMGETLGLLADRTDLLNSSLSCLCRHSLRDYRRSWVKSKFGIDLFQNRCGSCYKCCVEYIYLADKNKVPFSEAYYKYCLGQLYKVAQSEGVFVVSLYHVWDLFTFYPVTESKIYEQITKARLMIRSIKWVK